MLNILILMLVLSAYSIFFDNNVPENYEFYFTNKEKTEKVTLRFSQEYVNKYPGWEHDPHRTFSVSMWYPSLTEKVSPNFWMSSKKEFNDAQIKQNPDDRSVNLSIGEVVGSNTIVDPSMTLLGEKMPSDCHINGTFKKFITDGQVGNFNRYKYQGEHLVYYLYRPREKIKGLYCMQCSASCGLKGITDFGVRYSAVYKSQNIVEEAVELHRGINVFLTKKIVKKSQLNNAAK